MTKQNKEKQFKRKKRDKIKWLYPCKKDSKVSLAINKVFIGCLSELKKQKNYKHDYFYIKTPTISTDTYFNIVDKIIKKNHSSTFPKPSDTYKYLKFTKSGHVSKSCLKKILKFALGICPRCQYSNCITCTKNEHKNYMKNYHLLTKQTTDEYPKYVKCFNCQSMYKIRYHLLRKLLMNTSTFMENINIYYSIFRDCLGWQNQKCQLMYQNLYQEFLCFIRKKYNTLNSKSGGEAATRREQQQLNNNNNRENIKKIFDSLNESSQKELENNYESLLYTLNIKRRIRGEEGEVGLIHNNEDDIVQIPPMAFFIDMNKSMSFFKKLIEQDSSTPISNGCASIKTKYGSVISRCKGGKASLCRKLCCNRRHVLSARVVIVPRYQLEAHQCILPHILYNRLGCPKYVLCHRYPTLDLRSMTFHEVISTWTYPCMAISTSIVAGNNADFDGDCLHVIPATTLISQSELIYLMHPKYNMIAQNKLRVMFDHDERQTIYSQFGLNSSDIHRGLYQLALKEGSPKAYDYFCKLRHLCHFIWERRTVSTISFKDFMDIYKLFNKKSSSSSSLSMSKVSYVDYLNQIYPNISPQNGIKELIDSESSRFSVDHLWQFFGEISSDAPTSFLNGMSKKDFINVAMVSREALIKDVGFYGYNIIKLTHCTKSIIVGYDGCLYTTDGILIAQNVSDIIKK